MFYSRRQNVDMLSFIKSAEADANSAARGRSERLMTERCAMIAASDADTVFAKLGCNSVGGKSVHVKKYNGARLGRLIHGYTPYA